MNQGVQKDQITLLHCTSEYPASIDSVNMKAMIRMRDEFNVNVGYSDHTLNIETPIAAVAMGAVVIEKHFTLSRSMNGPDHAASLEPNELADMIVSIKNTEVLLGSDEKKPTAEEKENIKVARKSIVASKDILVGKVIEESDIDTKRPGDGISPMKWESIVGSVAKRSYKKNDQIT